MSAGQRLLFALASSLALSLPASAVTLFDPALRFKVLATEHFRIYFHQGEERLGFRLATIAEETWTTLSAPLGVTPPRLTHVVLADQTELANGYATTLPYDTVVLYAAWPRGEEFYTDDWLRLAFTHEFTHIVHLDRSESWARIVRDVFGRTLLAFPNLLLPTWQIEGLATYEESAMTGEGRLHAGDFRPIVEEAARRGVMEPLDRVNGGLTDWPAGLAPYAYGVGFHQYLVDRYGPTSLGRLAEATARRVPYTSSRAFRRIFGVSLGTLWRDYEATVASNAGVPALDSDISRLTYQGFVVSAPRFDRFTCAGCPFEVLFASRTPHRFPSLNRVRLTGTAPIVPTELTRRYFGSTTAIGRDRIYFDQLEVRSNVGVYSDLVELSRRSGRSRSRTSGARLLDPDLSPDESTIACVQQRADRRDLVLVRPNAGFTLERLLSEQDTQFNTPRWSPDGRYIVAQRQSLGALPQIVVVDVASREAKVITSDPRTRFVTPTWRPDGRAVVAAASSGEQPFNLFELQLDSPSDARQLTHTSGGAMWPDIAPDGGSLVFVGYTTTGFDLFWMPYTAPSSPSPSRVPTSPPVPASWDVVTPGAAAPAILTPGMLPISSNIDGTTHDYSPWRTLRPTSWFPIIEGDSTQVRFGASSGGRDVLGYHTYAASASWLVSHPGSAPAPQPASPDWSVSYAYDRWRPTLFAAASRTTSFFAGPATDVGTPTPTTRREHQLTGGVLIPFVHTRVSHVGIASVVRAVDDDSLPDRTLSRTRTAVRLAWETATAHTYGYSISPEEGAVSGVTLEVVRRGLGSYSDATTATADIRAYLPGLLAHHVVAARVAGGRSAGDVSISRTFLLGGAAPDTSVISFGSGAIRLLRGFPSNSFAGTHVALVNIDYRVPIARPQRGIGTWPFFVHTVHAALFIDAGHAWTRAFDPSAVKTSEGAELSANVVAGYYFPFTIAGGAAWGHDGSRTFPNGITAYVRIGKAF